MVWVLLHTLMKTMNESTHYLQQPGLTILVVLLHWSPQVQNGWYPENNEAYGEQGISNQFLKNFCKYRKAIDPFGIFLNGTDPAVPVAGSRW